MKLITTRSSQKRINDIFILVIARGFQKKKKLFFSSILLQLFDDNEINLLLGSLIVPCRYYDLRTIFPYFLLTVGKTLSYQMAWRPLGLQVVSDQQPRPACISGIHTQDMTVVESDTQLRSLFLYKILD